MKHHILLISIDALRADHLGCYGHPLDISPHLDALAAESVVFENAMSPTTWTLPGHMSMLSGLEPPVHGCVSSHLQYPPEKLPFPLIFELAERRNYEVLAVVGGGFMEPAFGFGRGVTNYHVVHPIHEASEWVAGQAQVDRLSFTFLHTYMVHDYPRITTQRFPFHYVEQHDPHYNGYFPRDKDFVLLLRALSQSDDAPVLSEADVRYVRDVYAAAVKAADFALRVLFKMLRDRRVWDETTVIVTSDHGESLGDVHGGAQYWFHAGPPYQEQLRVPLLIKPAAHLRGRLVPGTRVDQPVSLVDLAPTLLDLMECPRGQDLFDGRSLLELCQGQVAAFETRRLFAHSCEDQENPYLPARLFGASFGWRDNGKVIYDPRGGVPRELYWLQYDPGEQNNRMSDLSRRDRARLAEILALYRKRVERRAHHPPSVRFEDNSLLGRLQAMGYLDV